MIDFNKIKTIPICVRKNKFSIDELVSLEASGVLSDNCNLLKLSERVRNARNRGREFILMMGGHVIKVGMSNFINDLMRRNLITHVAMNGAGAIHDFELAYNGATSEDVSENIEDGSFGMADETGHYLNIAAVNAAEEGVGLGRKIGQMIGELGCKYKDKSILHNAYRMGLPATVHTAIGAETIYQHPLCDAGALGKSSYEDFKILTDSISRLEGGVVANVGCAVILPEVFLKAFIIARNLGFNVRRFTAANLDMIDHYRPRVNVVERPTSLGGEGFVILEKHEKSIPTLYWYLTRREGWS